MASAPGDREPERAPLGSSAQGSASADTRQNTNLGSDRRSGKAYTDLPTFDEPDKRKKSISSTRVMPIVAATVLAIGVGAYFLKPHDQAVAISAADMDQATTSRVVAELKAGGTEPEVSSLSDQEKAELISGERQFYLLPLSNAAGAMARNGSGDRIRVTVNGVPHGEYTLGGDPVTLELPNKPGDQFAVTCLSVGEGETAVAVKIATAVNPVETAPLAPGQSQTFTLRQGGGGQNFAWFMQEAQAGNAVAQYGLAHMFQYGLGVPKDVKQAAYWYHQAAAQNYPGAQDQLNALGQP